MTGSARLFKLLLVPTILLGTGSVWAQSSPPKQASEPARGARDSGRESDRDGDRDSLPDSVRRVERQTGGEVLRAEPMQRDGREVYRLKVLTADGRVRVMQEDPSDPDADHPARGRDRGQGRQKQKSKDASDGTDADPPL